MDLRSNPHSSSPPPQSRSPAAHTRKLAACISACLLGFFIHPARPAGISPSSAREPLYSPSLSQRIMGMHDMTAVTAHQHSNHPRPCRPRSQSGTPVFSACAYGRDPSPTPLFGLLACPQ